MSTLNINSANPVISITTTNAQMSITNKMRRFTMKRTPPQMTVERQMPQMRANRARVRAQLKAPSYLNSYLTSRSRQKLRQYIQQTMNNTTVSSAVGQENTYYNYNMVNRIYSQPMTMHNLPDSVPEVNPTEMLDNMSAVDWTAGTLHIDWTVGELEIEWDDDFMPEFDVTPYSIDIRLQGRPEVRIRMNEENAKRTDSVGRKVNKDA